MKKIILGLVGFILLLTLYAAVDMLQKMAEPKQQAASVVTEPQVEEPELSPAERKRRFIEKTLPAIERVKARLDAQYKHVLALSKKERLSDEEREEIKRLERTYKAEGMPCLLRRLHTHPVSIVLAQAALESGWGTSRFYKEANNIFGIWSYNADEPRIAAGETRGEKTIYVKKYPSLEASIEGYFKMIARSRAYKAFKNARYTEENPFSLIAFLTRYSELREEYVKRLYYVIKGNRFYTYDSPVYQPVALSQILPKIDKPKVAAAESIQAPEGDTLLLATAASEDDNVPCDEGNTTLDVSLSKEENLSAKAGTVAARTPDAKASL